MDLATRRGAVRRRRSGWVVGSIAAWVFAVPTIGSALDEAPSERDAAAWTPALAAWGAQAAPPSARQGAPLLSAHARDAASSPLVSVGQGAAGAITDRPAPFADETQRWVPGLALQSGVLGQNGEGSVDANSTVQYLYQVRQNGIRPANADLLVTRSLREGKVNFFSPNGSSRPTALVPGTPTSPGGLALPASGSNLLLTPSVGMSLELMTPGLQAIPGRPRVFFHSDTSLAFGIERSFGREGVPEGVEYPPSVTQPRPDEVQVRGVGSITEAEVKTLLVSGGIGVAFTFDAWGRRLRLKPSFEYLREVLDVKGRLVRAFRQNTGQAGSSSTPAVFLPSIDLEASDTLTSYGIGPGLELEMDAGRAGPVMLSVFASGQTYRMLGDRDLDLSSTAQIEVPDPDPTTPATQEVSAQWDFHKHAWSYRGGLGVRFRWAPEH